jgi:hypothetical protein
LDERWKEGWIEYRSLQEGEVFVFVLGTRSGYRDSEAFW